MGQITYAPRVVANVSLYAIEASLYAIARLLVATVRQTEKDTGSGKTREVSQGGGRGVVGALARAHQESVPMSYSASRTAWTRRSAGTAAPLAATLSKLIRGTAPVVWCRSASKKTRAAAFMLMRFMATCDVGCGACFWFYCVYIVRVQIQRTRVFQRERDPETAGYCSTTHVIRRCADRTGRSRGGRNAKTTDFLVSETLGE